MPLSINYRLPQTKDPNEFEDMVRDCFLKKFISAQRYGRKGQKQYGIDIIITFINSNRIQEYIAVQCKNYLPNEKELDKIISDAISGSKRLPSPLHKIVIAIGSERDTKTQDYILTKNSYGILIEPLFWEEISSLIASDTELMNRYYPQMQTNTISINTLIDFFNEGIQECHIIEIMRNEPLAGMPRSYALDMDIFCIEIEKQLNNAILLQKDPIYKKIQDFCNLIGNYNTYLAQHMHPGGTDYYSVIPGTSYDQMRHKITQIKHQMNECYMAINSGCSLFI